MPGRSPSDGFASIHRPTVRVTLACDNACLFCAQRGLPPIDEDSFAALQSARSIADDVTFVGGEPARAPKLIDLVANAKAMGFRGIGLQTNGRVLSDFQIFKPLVDAGLTDLHLSIHGAEAAVHDYHVGVPGAFAQAMATLGHARSIRLTTVATTVLTRSNYRVLGALPRVLASARVAGWLIAIPRTAGALSGRDDRVMPRLAIGLAGALKALESARSLGLASWIQGAPACLLGPYSSLLLPEDSPRAYAPVCAKCPSKPRCPGVDAAYLSRFGGDELSAKETVAATPFPAITRLFVGVGELAPPVAAEIAPPPAQDEAKEPAKENMALTQIRVGEKTP